MPALFCAYIRDPLSGPIFSASFSPFLTATHCAFIVYGWIRDNKRSLRERMPSTADKNSVRVARRPVCVMPSVCSCDNLNRPVVEYNCGVFRVLYIIPFTELLKEKQIICDGFFFSLRGIQSHRGSLGSVCSEV